MECDCDRYVCDNCVFNEHSYKLQKGGKGKSIFENLKVCRCDKPLTKKEFKRIVNSKKDKKQQEDDLDKLF